MNTPNSTTLILVPFCIKNLKLIFREKKRTSLGPIIPEKVHRVAKM